MNILLLMAGGDKAFKEIGYSFPKNLIEIGGKPMVQHVIGQLKPLLDKKAKLHALIQREENENFHTGTVIQLLVPDANIVEVRGPTAGAACSALLAIDHINNEDPLLIINGDILLHTDIRKVVADFSSKKLDGGIVVFEAVHPRWSFVRVNSKGLVEETAEKKPISRLATVGIYYFNQGSDFVEGAKDMIRKGDHVQERYYICPVYNQLVLKQKKIGVHKISHDQYVSLATPRDVEVFDRLR